MATVESESSSDGWETFERTFDQEQIAAQYRRQQTADVTAEQWGDDDVKIAYGPRDAVIELWRAEVWAAGYATARSASAVVSKEGVTVTGRVHREVRATAAEIVEQVDPDASGLNVVRGGDHSL